MMQSLMMFLFEIVIAIKIRAPAGEFESQAAPYRYLGIKYGEANRWEYPQPLGSNGSQMANAFGPACAQICKDGKLLIDSHAFLSSTCI